ncbi:hypothetical protein GF345_05605, partial [Candidatus Woesearchaeota archaeon]|nr:hypothetical protein [Candidatus Woesearchaeota archaeon]
MASSKKAQGRNIWIIVVMILALVGAVVILIFTGWGHNKIKYSLGCEGWFSGVGLEERECYNTETCPRGTKEEKGLLGFGCRDGVCCRGTATGEISALKVTIDGNQEEEFDIEPGPKILKFWGSGEVYKCTASLKESEKQVASQEIKDCKESKKGTITYDFKPGKSYSLVVKGFASSAIKIDEATIDISVGADTKRDDDSSDGDEGVDIGSRLYYTDSSGSEVDIEPGQKTYIDSDTVNWEIRCSTTYPECYVKILGGKYPEYDIEKEYEYDYEGGNT